MIIVNLKKEKGITLMALLIMIIILLILAGITITTLIGRNGLIENTGKAKNQTEISNEKEVLEKATVQAMAQDSRGNVDEKSLRDKLNGEAGEGKTELSDIGDEYEVLFKETNRYYTVDKTGNVLGPYDVVKDKYPGDITKDENGKLLDGSKDNPYEICCIEDLVVFSNMVNGEGIELKDGQPVEIQKSTSFSGQYVVLKEDLNFKSKLSYANSERVDFGNINGNAEDGNTLIIEMTTGSGFIPIGLNGSFNGEFNGNGCKIKNIYENTTGYIGLFAISASNVIKNLGLTGYMETSTDYYAGGLISYASHVTTVECMNCYTDITIIANNASMVGGIIGRGGTIKLENCYNIGNITANKGSAGGIIGYTNTTNIDSCYNLGVIKGESSGGIVGFSYYSTPLTIANSYNSGRVEGVNAGGIVGNQNGINSIIEIKNTYNLGDVTGTNVGGILNSNVSIPTIENCWNAGILSGNNIEASIIGKAVRSYVSQGKILHCFFLNTTDISCNYELEVNDSISMTINQMQNENFINELNNYIIENSKTWNRWKIGDNRYPILNFITN